MGVSGLHPPNSPRRSALGGGNFLSYPVSIYMSRTRWVKPLYFIQHSKRLLALCR